MFEHDTYQRLLDDAVALAGARTQTALATGAQLCDAARAVQQAQDVLDGAAADLLARMDDAAAHEDEGCSTLPSWMARELRIPRAQARARVKAGHTLRKLPDAAEALASGQIRLAHVYELTGGVTKLGAATMVDAQAVLLPIAKESDPGVLRKTIEHLQAVLYPEAQDDDWSKGADKNDVNVTRCGDGFHLSGFLDIPTGAKVQAFLKAASAPAEDGDGRAPSQRRVDALGRLIDTGVDAGQPGNGIRPQVHVIADLETLLGQPGSEPATLAGFGAIGKDLLGYLICTGDVTAVLADGDTDGPTPQARVLNVGRTTRLATPKQRAAVIARQDGHCANPGCANTSLDVHHVAWWNRHHGTTDLSNLVGLCSRCHHLVHRQKLTIEADGCGGYTFRRSTGRRIDDHARATRHHIRRALRRILRETAQDQPERHKQKPSAPTTPAEPAEPAESAESQPTKPRHHSRPEQQPTRARAPEPAVDRRRERHLRNRGYQLRPIRYSDLSDNDPPPTNSSEP